MLHAERDLCVSDGKGGERMVGAVVAYVMLDYSALSFISSQSPYYEFFRVPRTTREGTSGSDVELTVFGWGRLPMYTSLSRSWLLTDDVFNTAYQSRNGFWTELARGDGIDRVFVSNDRNGIYVVGYPVMTPFTHLVNLGELTAFGALLFAALIALTSLLRGLIGPGVSPLRLVVQEIRASFYRKLFIAFVAATLVPVLALALLVRASVASQLLADAEAGAARTALTAKRVIEESLALQQRELAGATVGGLTDDVMVWISRIIDQDVNIFDDLGAAGDQRARSVRVRPAADADAGAGPPRRRHRSAADLRRRGSHRRLRLSGGGDAGPHRRRATHPDGAAGAAAARDRARDRRARSRACCSAR